MSRPGVEWRGRQDFHEYAEVLGITTLQIVAVNRSIAKGVDFVIFSRDEQADEDSPVFGACVVRAKDGVLKVSVGPVEMPGFWKRLSETMERHKRHGGVSALPADEGEDCE